MKVGHEDGVVHLSEEPLEDIGDVLNEVVSNAQLDVPGVSSELLHQQLDPGLGPVLAVDPLVAQTLGARSQLQMSGPGGESRLLFCLTVLGDEGDAAVHDDGDVVAAQLLVPQGVALPSGCPLDVRGPQREVCPAHTLQMKSPEEEEDTVKTSGQPGSLTRCVSPPLLHQDQDVLLLVVGRLGSDTWNSGAGE